MNPHSVDFVCHNCNRQHTTHRYETHDFPKDGLRKHVYMFVCLPKNSVIGTITFLEPIDIEQNNKTDEPEKTEKTPIGLSAEVKRGRGRPRKINLS